MCLSLPTSHEKKRFDGRPPGPVKLFFGGLTFLLVLFLAGIIGVFRRGNRVA